MRKVMLPIVCALVLTACAKGNHYAVKPGEAKSRLAESEIPVMVFGSMATATETVQRGQDTIVWRVLDDRDDEMMRLAAHISPDGEGCRISTEVLPPEGARRALVERGMIANPAIVNLYDKVAEEQIDAVMNGREFSMAAITPAMMSATLSISRDIQQQAMRAASEAQKQSRTNIQQAYDDDAHGRSYSGDDGGSGTGPKFGEPMDGSEE